MVNYTLDGNNLICVMQGYVTFSVPANIQVIGTECFKLCRETLETVIFEGTEITQINHSAFSSCKNLVNLDISKQTKLKCIEKWAFTTTGLTKLCFPINCPIPFNGFSNSMVNTFEVVPNHFSMVSINGILFSKDMATIIAYPPQKLDSTYSILTSVTCIGECCFINVKHLKYVSIPKGCTTIQDWAFYGSGLVSCYVPDSVIVFGEWSYGSCESLKHAEIHAKLSTLPYKCFYDCYSLSSIYVDGNPGVAQVSFVGCKALGNIYASEDTKLEIERQAGYIPTHIPRCFTRQNLYFRSPLLFSLLLFVTRSD